MMKYRLSQRFSARFCNTRCAGLFAGAVLLVCVSSASAQLARSHASTVAAAQPDTSSLQASLAKPVARVNGAVLTNADLLREMYAMFPYARQHNGFPKGMEPEIRKGAMKMIIFEELVYQEALHRKMTIAPARLRRAEADFRKQFASPAQFQQMLNTEFKGSQALLRVQITRSLLIEDLLKLEVGDKANISVAQARAYYDKSPDRFRVPESFTFQSISILPPPNPTAAQLQEAHKRAADALRQAKATKSHDEFGLLAEKMSDDDFRVMMGEHKAADASKLPPAVLKSLQAMQPGQVSDIIEFDTNQFTILRFGEHIPAGTRSFEQVKDSLRDYLKKQRTEELRHKLNARLREKAKVEEL
jgi:peptidyl-prolyl cis-trans isomerase SurA